MLPWHHSRKPPLPHTPPVEITIPRRDLRWRELREKCSVALWKYLDGDLTCNLNMATPMLLRTARGRRLATNQMSQLPLKVHHMRLALKGRLKPEHQFPAPLIRSLVMSLMDHLRTLAPLYTEHRRLSLNL
jgi:hypothetical protein